MKIAKHYLSDCCGYPISEEDGNYCRHCRMGCTPVEEKDYSKSKTI